MPATISGLLVILFAVLPGVPGNNLYQRIVGIDRKEEQWSAVTRIIGFSIGGLILYIVIGGVIHTPLPIYISPSTFTNFVIERNILLDISLALSGHFLGSIVISLAVAGIVLFINRVNRASDYSDTWDKFARKYVEKHWVIVRISDGKTYAGILEQADTFVDQNERDIILKEPAIYLQDEDNYLSLPYQYLFLPGSIVSSIGVVADTEDRRITRIGTYLFDKPDSIKEHQNVRKRKSKTR